MCPIVQILQRSGEGEGGDEEGDKRGGWSMTHCCFFSSVGTVRGAPTPCATQEISRYASATGTLFLITSTSIVIGGHSASFLF